MKEDRFLYFQFERCIMDVFNNKGLKRHSAIICDPKTVRMGNQASTIKKSKFAHEDVPCMRPILYILKTKCCTEKSFLTIYHKLANKTVCKIPDTCTIVSYFYKHEGNRLKVCLMIGFISY